MDKGGFIKVIGLEKTYYDEGSRTDVLKGTSFEINKGEFVAIMGPSGSGKSTLLHILGLLDEPTGGEYFFDGQSHKNYTPAEVAIIRNERFGFVFQLFNLLARTTVLENVKLPLLYSKTPENKWDDKAKEIIHAVGLAHRMEHEPSELSGGERQRVAIARALVNDPDVVFADEPTGNLDSKSGQAVIDLMQRLQKERGNTVVLITHESSTAEHAERIIKILDGKIQSDEKVGNRRKAVESFHK